ncbi:MAG TPA: arginine deiminase family protein, partial [Candidatus Limnocylindria bacterium]|nr:arginine deiminase family protein [Candidatus Limnocylindria bacterium]
AACVDALSFGLLAWLRASGFELVEVSPDDAFTLGANAISLGGDRVLSAAGAGRLNAALRARGLEVLDPDLEMLTLGGGGPHCLAQALRRERVR